MNAVEDRIKIEDNCLRLEKRVENNKNKNQQTVKNNSGKKKSGDSGKNKRQMTEMVPWREGIKICCGPPTV